MLIPTVHRQSDPSADDYRELNVALRLLAGHECKRDPQQSHTMLVRLMESNSRAVSQDARTVMQEALRKKWFDDVKPFHQDLEMLASRTARRRAAGLDARLVAALAAGVAVLLGLVVFYVAQSEGEVNFPIIGVGILVVLAAMLFLRRRR